MSSMCKEKLGLSDLIRAREMAYSQKLHTLSTPGSWGWARLGGLWDSTLHHNPRDRSSHQGLLAAGGEKTVGFH